MTIDSNALIDTIFDSLASFSRRFLDFKKLSVTIGSSDNDILEGGPDTDLIVAGQGNDTISGYEGHNILFGGSGLDTFKGGPGKDLIIGGSGIDTVRYDDIASGVNVNLLAGTATHDIDVDNNAGLGDLALNSATDRLRNIENIVGSNAADVIVGNDQDNLLEGLDGNDTLQGNQGQDTLEGGLADDLLEGGGGNDQIDGGAGNDFIDGAGGTDNLDGGEGIDTNSFINIGAEVVANLGSGSASYQTATGDTVFENFANFENLDGSAQNDQLFGDDDNNELTGNDGDDLLTGSGGEDTVRGGLGDDILQGGPGNDVTDGGEGTDVADFQNIGTDVNANLETGQAQYEVNGTQIQDQLNNIENLTGSTNNDTLTGDATHNVLAGNAGDDSLVGGAGDDVLRGDELGSGTAIQVTVTNTLDEGGTFITPVWFGFHDGANFDLFDEGSTASAGLERLAEDGAVEGIAAEFNTQVGDNGIDGVIPGGVGVPGPIDPNESASFSLDVDPNQVGQGFFTWGTMVIPSNDAFLAAPDDVFADAIFDTNGNFTGPIVIERRGSDVLDAGTEVNTEEDAAFLNQLAPNTGVDENGVVGAHPGFNGSVGNLESEPSNILGGTTAPGTTIDPITGDFTANDEVLLQIEIEQVAVVNAGNDILEGGAGNDILEGGGGDDTLTGGVGNDTFIFDDDAGLNTITDFSIADDALDVSAIFDDFQDVLGNVSQAGDNTLVDFGDHNSVLLLSVHTDNLTSDNFAFG